MKARDNAHHLARKWHLLGIMLILIALSVFGASAETTIYPYWIEHDENGNPINYLWIKVNLTANQPKEIWVYYGNDSAPSYVDGDKVFEFFDDFDIDKGYVNIGPGDGSYTLSDSIIHMQQSSQGAGYDYALKLGDFNFGSDKWIISLYAAVPEECEFHAVGTKTADAYPYGSYYFYGTQSEVPDQEIFSFDTMYSGSGNFEKLSTIVDDFTDGYQVWLALDNDANPGVGKQDVDWLFVRKYSSSEPSVSVGDEETGAWTINGYTYTKRRKITITSSEDLTDYQVGIPLSQLPFITSKDQALAITDDPNVPGYKLYDYWIEHDENGNPINYLWTKVSIPAGGTKTLYIKKVDGYAPNGDAVFEFFDDFDGSSLDTSKWDNNGGTVTISNSILEYSGTDNQLRSFDTFSNSILVSRFQAVDSVDDRSVGFLEPPSSTNAWYYNNVRFYNALYRTQLCVDGVCTNGYTGFSPDGAWHNAEIKYTSTEVQFIIDNIVYANATSGIPTGSLSAGFRSYANSSVYSDWIFVRKYADQEPSVSVSDEGDYYKVTISNLNSYDLVDYQVAIPISEMGITNAYESLKITDEQPIEDDHEKSWGLFLQWEVGGTGIPKVIVLENESKVLFLKAYYPNLYYAFYDLNSLNYTVNSGRKVIFADSNNNTGYGIFITKTYLLNDTLYLFGHIYMTTYPYHRKSFLLMFHLNASTNTLSLIKEKFFNASPYNYDSPNNYFNVLKDVTFDGKYFYLLNGYSIYTGIVVLDTNGEVVNQQTFYESTPLDNHHIFVDKDYIYVLYNDAYHLWITKLNKSLVPIQRYWYPIDYPVIKSASLINGSIYTLLYTRDLEKNIYLYALCKINLTDLSLTLTKVFPEENYSFYPLTAGAIFYVPKLQRIGFLSKAYDTSKSNKGFIFLFATPNLEDVQTSVVFQNDSYFSYNFYGSSEVYILQNSYILVNLNAYYMGRYDSFFKTNLLNVLTGEYTSLLYPMLKKEDIAFLKETQTLAASITSNTLIEQHSYSVDDAYVTPYSIINMDVTEYNKTIKVDPYIEFTVIPNQKNIFKVSKNISFKWIYIKTVDKNITVNLTYYIKNENDNATRIQFNITNATEMKYYYLNYTIQQIDAHDNLTVVFNETDDEKTSIWQQTYLVLNTPPTAPTSISLSPLPVRVTQTITATASGGTDIDGDTLTYYYQFKDLNTGDILQDWSTNNTLYINYTIAHHTIAVNAYANDSYGGISDQYTTTFSIQNTFPKIVSYYVYPNETVISDKVCIKINVTDIDHDPVNVNLKLGIYPSHWKFDTTGKIFLPKDFAGVGVSYSNYELLSDPDDSGFADAGVVFEKPTFTLNYPDYNTTVCMNVPNDLKFINAPKVDWYAYYDVEVDDGYDKDESYVEEPTQIRTINVNDLNTKNGNISYVWAFNYTFKIIDEFNNQPWDFNVENATLRLINNYGLTQAWDLTPATTSNSTINIKSAISLAYVVDSNEMAKSSYFLLIPSKVCTNRKGYRYYRPFLILPNKTIGNYTLYAIQSIWCDAIISPSIIFSTGAQPDCVLISKIIDDKEQYITQYYRKEGDLNTYIVDLKFNDLYKVRVCSNGVLEDYGFIPATSSLISLAEKPPTQTIDYIGKPLLVSVKPTTIPTNTTVSFEMKIYDFENQYDNYVIELVDNNNTVLYLKNYSKSVIEPTFMVNVGYYPYGSRFKLTTYFYKGAVQFDSDGKPINYDHKVEIPILVNPIYRWNVLDALSNFRRAVEKQLGGSVYAQIFGILLYVMTLIIILYVLYSLGTSATVQVVTILAITWIFAAAGLMPQWVVVAIAFVTIIIVLAFVSE